MREREKDVIGARIHSQGDGSKRETVSQAAATDGARENEDKCKHQCASGASKRGAQALALPAPSPSSLPLILSLSLSLDDDVDEAAGAAAASHQEFKCNLILTSAVLLLLQRQSGRRGGRKIQGIKSFRQTLTKRRRRKHALSLSQAHAWQHSRSHGERGRSGIESVLTHQTLGIRSTNFQST